MVDIKDIEVLKYSPQKGDVFLVKIRSDDLEENDISNIKEKFQKLLEGMECKVVVFGVGQKDNVNFSVVRKEEAKS